MEKLLFEIPVYSMSEGVFSRRWEKVKTKMQEQFVSAGHTETEAKDFVNRYTFPQCVWRYNQIVGYIRISVTSTDVVFTLFKSLDKRYGFRDAKKHFVQDINMNGTHFYAAGMSDVEIIEQIRVWLKEIKKTHLKSSFVLDYTSFENTVKFIPFREIMSQI